MKRLASRRIKDRKQRGAAAVELALVAPFLVLMFLGTVQIASLFFTRHSLIHAARSGARELAIQGASEDGAIAMAEDYLTTASISGAKVSAQNAYTGSGDDAAARQVWVEIEMPIDDAMLLGDSLNLFDNDFKLKVRSSMRKEGELVASPD